MLSEARLGICLPQVLKNSKIPKVNCLTGNILLQYNISVNIGNNANIGIRGFSMQGKKFQ